MADVVTARDVAHRLAVIAPPDRLFLLMRRELKRSAHLHPARLRALAAFARARADQVALELCVMRCTA